MLVCGSHSFGKEIDLMNGRGIMLGRKDLVVCNEIERYFERNANLPVYPNVLGGVM